MGRGRVLVEVFVGGEGTGREREGGLSWEKAGSLVGHVVLPSTVEPNHCHHTFHPSSFSLQRKAAKNKIAGMLHVWCKFHAQATHCKAAATAAFFHRQREMHAEHASIHKTGLRVERD